MDLKYLALDLKKYITKELPGAKAHEEMRAYPVGQVIPKFEHKLPPKPGSVLIALYPSSGIISFPLIKRPDYLGAHSGQVSLPGGKQEPGEDAIATALREANEEIGLESEAATVLGTLSDFFVVPSNFLVTPVVAVIDDEPDLTPDSHEVARILRGRIHDLLSDDAIITKEILAAGRYTMRAPHFEIEGEVVWGATAMILNELRWILRDILK